MRKGRDPPSKLPWRTVVLIELEWGFAFFDVANRIFDMPVNMIWAHFTHLRAARAAVYFLDLIKVDDKSAVWRSDDGPVWSSDGPDRSFAYLAKEYSSGAKRFIVGDEKLRRLIKSNLRIDCFNEEENVVHEVVWGLRYALPFLIPEFIYKITISRQCPLPLCQGFEDLMKKYKIVIPTKAVDRDFVACAGSLQRVDELRVCRCTEMRKACDKLVPGISGMIKDNSRYVEVMAKILLVQWDPYKWSIADELWFTPDEMQKVVAKDAASGDARKKVEVDHELAAMIKGNLRDYRRYPKSEGIFLRKLRSCEAKAKRGQKRSHTEMAQQEVDVTGGVCVSEEK